MDAQLKSMLKQTIWIAAMTGVDWSTMEPTYGTPASHACRITGRIQRVTNVQGEEVVSTQQIVLVGPVSHSDRVWLPGEDHTKDDEAHYPKAVANNVDERGNHDYSMIYL